MTEEELLEQERRRKIAEYQDPFTIGSNVIQKDTADTPDQDP